MALRPRPPATAWGQAFEIGMQFGGAVLLGALAGYYLDRWLGTAPWLLLVFIALGFAAGVRNLLRLLPTPPSDPGPDEASEDGSGKEREG